MHASLEKRRSCQVGAGTVLYLHVSLNSEVTYVGEYAVCDRQLANKEGLFLYSGIWAE